MEPNQDSRESAHWKYTRISVSAISMGKQVKAQIRNVTKYSRMRGNTSIHWKAQGYETKEDTLSFSSDTAPSEIKLSELKQQSLGSLSQWRADASFTNTAVPELKTLVTPKSRTGHLCHHSKTTRWCWAFPSPFEREPSSAGAVPSGNSMVIMHYPVRTGLSWEETKINRCCHKLSLWVGNRSWKICLLIQFC